MFVFDDFSNFPHEFRVDFVKLAGRLHQKFECEHRFVAKLSLLDLLVDTTDFPLPFLVILYPDARIQYYDEHPGLEGTHVL